MVDESPQPPQPPAAWYPDPSGRHQYRYFDGTDWTAHVANNGATARDELALAEPPPPPHQRPAGSAIQRSNESASPAPASAPTRSAAATGPRPRGMVATVAYCFDHATDFRGRAPRAEYWWFALFRFLVLLIATNVGVRVGGETGAYQLALIVVIVLLVPYLAVSVRRLHDQGLTGWFMLLELVPFVGSLLLIALMARRSDPTVNRFGPPIATTPTR